MKKVIVASKNPTKIQATRNGFEEMFPSEVFQFQGVRAPSGVSDQPMGDEETFQGAWNRVQAAKLLEPEANYWIGIEGGNIQHNTTDMEVMAWVVACSAAQMGKARTAGFFLPPKVIQLVQEGYELAHANDLLFGVSNSKHAGGASGLLTDDVITRVRFYTPAVILALIPFFKPDLYAVTVKEE